jgi:hypothetical protein
MNPVEQPEIESAALSDFARVMHPAVPSECNDASRRQAGRLQLDQDNVKNGLGQLVLTLVKLIHELLERQAIRRFDAGSLGDEEIDRLGLTLMKQAEEIEGLRKALGLEEEDLNIDLGPLGRLL